MRNVVGLDVSKNTFDAMAIVTGQKYTAVFENNRIGFDKFKTWLGQMKASDLHICMEATGNYYEDVADAIGEIYKVSVVNPLKINNYAKSRFSRTKTDKQDAKLIAEYCQTALDKDLPERKPLTHGHYRLKRLLALYDQLKAKKAAEKNRMKAAKDEFVKQVHKDLIQIYTAKLKAVQAEINASAKSESDLKQTFQRMQTIPSVGKLTAAALANYLLSGQFQTANQFIAFAGLNPQAKQSGISVNGKARLTRYGNRRLRGALFMSAMVAYREGYFRQFVTRLQRRQKSTMVILVAIMRKLAVIAYHLHKKQENYNPERYKPV